MKGMLTLKKSAVIAAVCLAVLCVLGCKNPTPEHVAKREQKKALKSGEAMIDKFLQNGAYIKYYGDEITYVLLVQISSIDVTENSFAIYYDYGLNPHTWCFYVNENHISLDKDCNIIVRPKNVKHIKERTELLFKAVENKDVEWAKLCIKLGADVNAKNSRGTPLLIKAIYGNKDMVELLINSGADVNAKDKEGVTALMSACTHDNKDIAELLINSGADLNAISKGWTALSYASRRDVKDVVEMLVKANPDRDTALILAVKNGDSGVAKLLIDAGANVNVKDSEGISVLTHAALYKYNDIADLLRAAGAKE